jgi:hypothetical protein
MLLRLLAWAAPSPTVSRGFILIADMDSHVDTEFARVNGG